MQRSTHCTLACWLVVLGATMAQTRTLKLQRTDDESWAHYKQLHSKQYADNTEEQHRRSLWQKNVNYINRHNVDVAEGRVNFTVAVNKYSDLTDEEYRKFMLGYVPSKRRTARRLATANANTNGSVKLLSAPARNGHTQIPRTLDWRLRGYVTPVKDQGRACGACWAFAATGALEGQHFKKTHKLISLSAQNLIDCVHAHPYEEESSDDDNSYNNYENTDEFGCAGADLPDAFYYITKNGGIDTEKSYPYEAKEGECRFSKKTIGAKATGFIELPVGDEDAIKEAVALVGPIAAALDAGHLAFRHYQRGLFSSWFCSSDTVNHAVLIVGYGTNSDGDDYWLVKNSWGNSWGMNGYAMIPRNAGNYCGIATDCCYPTVD